VPPAFSMPRFSASANCLMWPYIEYYMVTFVSRIILIEPMARYMVHDTRHTSHVTQRRKFPAQVAEDASPLSVVESFGQWLRKRDGVSRSGTWTWRVWIWENSRRRWRSWEPWWAVVVG